MHPFSSNSWYQVFLKEGRSKIKYRISEIENRKSKIKIKSRGWVWIWQEKKSKKKRPQPFPPPFFLLYSSHSPLKTPLIPPKLRVITPRPSPLRTQAWPAPVEWTLAIDSRAQPRRIDSSGSGYVRRVEVLEENAGEPLKTAKELFRGTEGEGSWCEDFFF